MNRLAYEHICITIKNMALPFHDRDADNMLHAAKQVSWTGSDQREAPLAAFRGSHAQELLYGRKLGP